MVHILDVYNEEFGCGPGTSGVSSHFVSVISASNMAEELNFLKEGVQKVFGNVEIQGVPPGVRNEQISESPPTGVKN